MADDVIYPRWGWWNGVIPLIGASPYPILCAPYRGYLHLGQKI